MHSDLEENPPWVDGVLNRNFDAIVAKVGIERMPIPEALEPGKRKKTYKEFGVGSYGAVYPTATPGIVFKISSDPTEARFITASMSLPEEDRPAGIVRYYGVWETREVHLRRRVYVIIREEAENVGGLVDIVRPYPPPDRQLQLKAQSVLAHLDWFRKWADLVRKKFDAATDEAKTLTEIKRLSDWAEENVDWSEIEERIRKETYPPKPLLPSWMKGAQAAAYGIRAAQIVAEDMTNEDIGYLVGEALGYFLEQGLLLADVHGNNVGQVRKEGYSNPVWVITDPGHMVPISMKWRGTIRIPKLQEES
jgi:hypothetical protein